MESRKCYSQDYWFGFTFENVGLVESESIGFALSTN